MTSGDIDSRLRAAGAAWRAGLPPDPSVGASIGPVGERRSAMYRLARPLLGSAAFVALAALLAISLPNTLPPPTSAPGATAALPSDEPSEEPGATASSTAPADSCISSHRMIDVSERTIELMARHASEVVVGTFRGEGEAFWDSPTGERPATIDEARDSRLLTPVTLDIVVPLRGLPRRANSGVVWGGRLGCDVMISERPYPELVEGEQYVFFMIPFRDATGRISERPLIQDVWPVTDKGKVKVPNLEQPMSVDELAAALVEGIGPKPPTPGPGEPGQSMYP